MYTVAHEFTFEINQDGRLLKFVGQLIFKNSKLNDIGSLNNDDDMDKFGVILNQQLHLPNYWTLEILAQTLFEKIRPIYSTLFALNIYLSSSPSRVAEYSLESNLNYNGFEDILELENIIG